MHDASSLHVHLLLSLLIEPASPGTSWLVGTQGTQTGGSAGQGAMGLVKRQTEGMGLQRRF